MRPAPCRDHAPNIQKIFALHFEASPGRDELIEEVRASKAAGKIGAARAATEQADAQQRNTAFEYDVRQRGPS
jgi:hypothetical protein